MKVKAPQPAVKTETPEEKTARVSAEEGNIRSIQASVQARSSIYQRLRSPRVSLATGRRFTSGPIGR